MKIKYTFITGEIVEIEADTDQGGPLTDIEHAHIHGSAWDEWREVFSGAKMALPQSFWQREFFQRLKLRCPEIRSQNRRSG